MYNSQEIANRIKLLSKQQGKSLAEVLTACNLGVNTVAKINKGADILTLNFAKIADYLDCSVDYLLGRDDTHTTGVSHVSNSVVMHTNTGDHVAISNSSMQSNSEDDRLNEQEKELVRTFRTLDMRRKTAALTLLYELEDQINEKRI